MSSCAARGCPPPAGTARSHCAAGSCHRTFSGVSAFDKHQTLGENGVTCHDPASRGLVLRDLHGVMTWCWPEREDAGWVSTRRNAQAGGPGVRKDGGS